MDEPKTIEWDDVTIAHIARHGVAPEHVEEVLTGCPIRFRAETCNGELRYSYIGPTRSGWLLFVVVTERGGKLRVVTAHRADTAKVKWYRQIIKEMIQ